MTKSSQQALPFLSQKTINIPEPPVEVFIDWLTGWLKAEYARTGRWPKYSNNGGNNDGSLNYYQPPMPGLGGPVEALTDQKGIHHHKHTKAGRRTGFDYRGSEYWAAAGQLIEEQDARPVAVELRYGCQLVLSLVLAWMHFPLFNTGARQGEWMTLGCDRMCKELHITSRNVLTYMSELQRCGLVLPGRLDTGLISRLEFDTLKADLAGMDVAACGGDYWQARCVQQKSTFYRLKPGISRPSLPEFNPFSPQVEAERQEKDLERTWDGPGKDVQSAFELETGEKRTCSTSFPGPHDHDSEYEHDMKIEMDPKQLEKYTFLRSIHEKFNGCQCGEMLEAAATRLSSQYEMAVLKAALSKVGRDWARNSHLIENPVALFISELPKQVARPRSGGGNSGRRKNRSGPIDMEKYTTGKYKHLTQS